MRKFTFLGKNTGNHNSTSNCLIESPGNHCVIEYNLCFMSFSNYQIAHMCSCHFFLPCRSITARYILNHISLAVAFQHFSPIISFGSELAYHSRRYCYDQIIWVQLPSLQKQCFLCSWWSKLDLHCCTMTLQPLQWLYSHCKKFIHAYIQKLMYTFGFHEQRHWENKDWDLPWMPVGAKFLFINIHWHTQQ